jgi:hypothetical protein
MKEPAATPKMLAIEIDQFPDAYVTRAGGRECAV